jgi:hypothetical protein
LLFLIGLNVIFERQVEKQTITLCHDLRPEEKLPEKNILKDKISLFPSTCDNINTNAFEKIYAKGLWGGKRKEPSDYYENGQYPPNKRYSSSGSGSNLGFAVNSSLEILRRAIQTYNISSMIDLPCGDVNWIFDSWETDSLEVYIGLDIVRPIIHLNQQRFRHHSNKIFLIWDGSACNLPKYSLHVDMNDEPVYLPVDMVHCRDILQHMSLSDSIKFLCHVMTSGARILIITTFPSGANKNISNGGYYRNNLDLPPFSLPRDETNCIITHPTLEPDKTCIYDLTSDWVEGWVHRHCLAQRS